VIPEYPRYVRPIVRFKNLWPNRMREPHKQREKFQGVAMNVKVDDDTVQTGGREDEMEIKHHA
jgi:hypothetical protein